jgi:large subunit ribosomal protein L5
MLEQNPGANTFALPQIKAICLNVGLGNKSFADTKKKMDAVALFEKMVGQKVKTVRSKVSIASFKLRKNEVVGATVTLRGQKARDFLMQLVYVALPRQKDFHGVRAGSFDRNFGTYSLGIENTSIFPAIGFDNEVNFGMQVNIVFKNKTEMNLDFLRALNVPFERAKA